MNDHTATADHDLALLQRYARHGSGDDFAVVVARYADFVFATALRQTRNRELAEDITQGTFIVLARRAGSLRRGASIAAFLHQTALYAAQNALRAAARRRKHEANVAIHPHTAVARETAADDAEGPIAVALDDALLRLRERDRRLLMLHYFDGLTVTAAAAQLAITHEAARKRLHRALDRLREILARAGTATNANVIPTVLSSMAHPAVHPRAASILAAHAITGSAAGLAGTIAHQGMRTIYLLMLKKAAAVVAIAIAAGAVVAGGVVGVRAMLTPPKSAIRTVTYKPADARAATMVQTAGSTTSPAAAGIHIIDYDKVFSNSRRVIDERARLEQIQQRASAEATARKKIIGSMRQQVQTAGPALRARYENELRQAIANDAQLSKSEQSALAATQAKVMLDIFVQIEDAIQTVAQSQGVKLPPGAFPPYPANIDRYNVMSCAPW